MPALPPLVSEAAPALQSPLPAAASEGLPILGSPITVEALPILQAPLHTVAESLPLPSVIPQVVEGAASPHITLSLPLPVSSKPLPPGLPSPSQRRGRRKTLDRKPLGSPGAPRVCLTCKLPMNGPFCTSMWSGKG